MPKKTIIILITLFLIIGGITWYFKIQKGFCPWQGTKPLESKGAIEGSLGYPSEKIPEDMRICAEDIKTAKKYCSDKHINDSKYTYGKGYKLFIPSGDYYIFAKVENIDQYAYYSEFVTCGLSADCSSHKPIKVSIEEGEFVTGVDPIDWYIGQEKRADFIETGNLVAGDNNGWALLYEEPGKSALKIDLRFTDRSLCDLGQETKSCIVIPNDYWQAGERVRIEGRKQDKQLIVHKLELVNTKDDLIQIFKPLPNEVIKSPLKIRGKARGSWFFEADFPVILTDWDGLIISEGVAQTQEEWMTENFIPFFSKIEFEKPEFKDNGTLILRKDNPSGLPEHDNALEINIFLTR